VYIHLIVRDTDQNRARLYAVATQCTAARLRRASRAMSHVYDTAIAPSGLRGTQFSLVVALSLHGQATVARLADQLGLDRTTMTRNLAPLERDRLVVSAPGADRRVRLIQLSDAGRRALAAALPLWEQAQRRIVDALGERRWRELVTALDAATTVAVGEG
jgi:DNA-binding MarR family transcriptional regulator